jgi:maleate cis-trans isomerase
LSECTGFRTFSTFSPVLRDLGRPLLSSSSTFLRVSLNSLCHSKALEHCTSVTCILPQFHTEFNVD